MKCSLNDSGVNSWNIRLEPQFSSLKWSACGNHRWKDTRTNICLVNYACGRKLVCPDVLCFGSRGESWWMEGQCQVTKRNPLILKKVFNYFEKEVVPLLLCVEKRNWCWLFQFEQKRMGKLTLYHKCLNLTSSFFKTVILSCVYKSNEQ